MNKQHGADAQTKNTFFVTDGSEPLATRIVALKGSRAELVAIRVRDFIEALRQEKQESFPKRLNVTVSIVNSVHEFGEGLILGPTRGPSYSMRYRENPETGQQTISIGELLPDHRIDQAAREIIAMLERGVCTWVVKNPKNGEISVTRSAYGVVAKPKVEPVDKNAWREKRQRLSATRRMFFMHDSH